MDSERIESLLLRLRECGPEGDPKFDNHLAALRDELMRVGRDAAEQEKLLAEYEEAYTKLTQPANKIGVFLRFLDKGNVLIALGDGEFVSILDPKLDASDLQTGSRVMLNEAYAVVGILPAHESGTLFKVADVLTEDRLRISTDAQSQAGRIVFRGENIRDAEIVRGDEVRLELTGRVAVEHVPQSEVKDYFVEDVPEVPWTSIGGQEEALKLVRETLELPLVYPDLFAKFDKKPVKGILLYGPPGCGKTLIGKAIAFNLAKDYSERMGRPVREYFMHISGPKILNMWLGETERMVREIFETARKRAKEGRLVVIFMDEAEAILRTRSSGRWLNISNTVVPQFCAEMDGLIQMENVVLVLTSNRPDYIDPAILRPERIDRKVKIRRPDRAAAKQILTIYIHSGLPADPELIAQHDGEPACARLALIEGALQHLWREEKGTEFLNLYRRDGSNEILHFHHLVSGALLKSIVDRAKDFAIQRAIGEPTVDHGIRLQDMFDAIDAEFRENEIFPKTDVMEDWHKLIDVDPETVANIRPIRPTDSDNWMKKTVI